MNHEADTFGINGDFTLDYGVAYKRSRRVANGLSRGVQFLMRKNKIESFEGWATINDANSLSVALNGGEREELRFKNLIIATGAETKLLPGTALSERVVTYEEQIMEDKLPASVIIAGAGAVGVEFAYIMRNYGVEVTIVEFLDRILPLEDPEISAELAKAFKKLGIKMMTGARVDSIEESGDGVAVLVTRADGAPETLRAERVLQAIGFQPRVEGYGLENLGLRLNEAQGIEINDKMRTNAPNVYAIGDVTAKLMLAHVAETMGVVAAENIAGAPTIQLDFDMMPRATYCQPQVASFGYTEAQAKRVVSIMSQFLLSGKAKPACMDRFVNDSDAKYGRDLAPILMELIPSSAEMT